MRKRRLVLMDRTKVRSVHLALLLVLSLGFFLMESPVALAGDPYSGSYCAENNRVFWFIQSSDVHVGARGDQDSGNLQWLVTQGKDVIQPNFIVVSGDLTDSTNGNFFGYPDGPHPEEWNLYQSILSGRVDAGGYYDLPGNHDHYNDQYFSYYLANSIQGRASGNTQVSWIRTFDFGKYHFIGINTADNTGSPFSLDPTKYYGDHAGLDASELAFIENELSLHQDADLTFIFGHHPLSPTGNSSDTYVYYGGDEFASLMQTNGVSLYGYGHTHEASESFYTHNVSPGVYYFNVASLGKSSENQYSVTAIDCNGVSSATQTVGTWPVVLITAPMDKYLGGTFTPFVYPVPNSTSNPIRALVFDPSPIISVKYRINGGAEQSMAQLPGNPHLWEGFWNATTLPQGEQIIEVWASTGSGTRGNVITVSLQSQEQPKLRAGEMIAGKYETTGTKRNRVTTFVPTQEFKQGDAVVFQVKVVDLSGGPVANATAEISISGRESTMIVSGLSNPEGVAEAKWQTSAPNKRGVGGTLAGPYKAILTKLSASGYLWDGVTASVDFTILGK
jgi:hypothetical protein